MSYTKPIYHHEVYVKVYNVGKDGLHVSRPSKQGSTWVVSKHKTLEGLNSDRFKQMQVLRRLKNKGSIHGDEKVVFTKIYETITTNVNTNNGE